MIRYAVLALLSFAGLTGSLHAHGHVFVQRVAIVQPFVPTVQVLAPVAVQSYGAVGVQSYGAGCGVQTVGAVNTVVQSVVAAPIVSAVAVTPVYSFFQSHVFGVHHGIVGGHGVGFFRGPFFSRGVGRFGLRSH